MNELWLPALGARSGLYPKRRRRIIYCMKIQNRAFSAEPSVAERVTTKRVTTEHAQTREAYRVFIVGAGAMAEAFIRGVTERKAVPPEQIYVTNRSGGQRLLELQRLYGVCPAQSLAQIAECDLVVVSVKPADMAAALAQIRPFLNGQLLLSFAAGVNRDWMREQVAGHAHVIRAMPNIPVAVLSGATAVTFGPEIDDAERRHVLYLLGELGVVVELPEDLMDVATAFSGSGPGFVSYFLEAMENAAVQLGFEPETARLLLLQTVVGTAHTLSEWRLSPAELRARVTSKGGTTHAGLTALQSGNLEGVVLQALRAATDRSAEMGHQYQSHN